MGVSHSLWLTLVIVHSFSNLTSSFSTLFQSEYATVLALMYFGWLFSCKLNVAVTPLTSPNISSKTVVCLISIASSSRLDFGVSFFCAVYFNDLMFFQSSGISFSQSLPNNACPPFSTT